MKIVHIINSLESGGAEKLLLETLPLYNKRGFQVDLLVLNDVDCQFMRALKAAECCSIYSLGSHSVYNPIIIFKIIPFLKKYDIAHIHLFPTQYWAVLAKLFSSSKVKLVLTEHTTSNPRKESYFLRRIDRFFYRFYDNVVCVSDEVLKIFQNYVHLHKSKFVLIENGVNLDKIHEAKPYSLEEISDNWNAQNRLLIQVARFSKEKDQKTLIEALKYLPTNVKLVLVGEGAFKSSCEKLVKELQLGDRVLFLGLRMDVPKLLKTADIVVLSSKHEGLSLSSIEGMASGRPFVASNVSGLAGIVENAGVLFEQGDSNGLALHIAELLSNPLYMQEIVANCQARAERFNINSMVEKHLELYKKLFNK